MTEDELAELERLLADGNVTPGPYGFQSYGRRERLVTMAAATQGGTGEPFATFNRAEDAKAFARVMSALPSLLSEIRDLRGARDKALEEAAKECDRFARGESPYSVEQSCLLKVAKSIRSLLRGSE